jgi:hypothetical protein
VLFFNITRLSISTVLIPIVVSLIFFMELNSCRFGMIDKKTVPTLLYALLSLILTEEI